MRNRILEIVVFLMDFMRENHDPQSDSDELAAVLLNMGYSDHEITTAYSWFIDHINGNSEHYYSDFPEKHSSNRILTSSERMKISPDAYGFLMKLINSALIDDEQLEIIIDRVTFLATEPVNLEQVKIIASSIVFKESDNFEDLSVIDPTGEQSQSIN